MGGGTWEVSAYTNYATTRGRRIVKGKSTTQNMFTEINIHKDMNPYKVIRECCDSAEHPNTIPVILALDVTGSMGKACKETASALNLIMNDLLTKYKDIEFLIMGIGDLAYDDAPIQASQFESDIRIAEAVDKIYFEAGGGGNQFESYSAAWYFGLNNCKLDCWKRGHKGIIITMGDEPLNPYLPGLGLNKSLGCRVQSNIETNILYNEALAKFDIFHIAIDDPESCYSDYASNIQKSFGQLLGNRFKVSTLNELNKTISGCIDEALSNIASINNSETTGTETTGTEAIGIISW